MLIVFGLAALLGFTNSSYYKDLAVWAFWCLICATLAFVAMLKVKKDTVKPVEEKATEKAEEK